MIKLAILGASYLQVLLIKKAIEMSFFISIWFFSGLLLVMFGVVGLYVGKTFEGFKKGLFI